jgi:ubiquitin-activating enzyme E1
MSKLNVIEFEKDDDTNHHVDVINSCTNLRASNYDIPTINKFETKIIAGKIIPAIATTTSIVAGLVTIEILKYILGKSKDKFKNTYLNIGLSVIAQSEPMPCTFYKVKDEKVSAWDFYEVKKDMTIKDLLSELSLHYEMNIDTLLFNNSIIVSPLPNSSQNNYSKKISEIIRDPKIVKNKIKDKVIEFQIDSLMEEDIYLPNVKYFIT